MARVLLILHYAGYLRNYVTSGALAAIEAEHEIHYGVSADLRDHPAVAALPQDRVSTFQLDPREVQRTLDHFFVLTWRHRAKSTSFRHRTYRNMHAELLRWHGDVRTSLRHWGKWVDWFARDRKMKKALLFGTSSRLFALYDRARPRRPVSPQLDAVVARTAPDVVVLPSSAYDPLMADLADIRARRAVQTLYLIDNWDNLSSKIILQDKPDWLAVWGEQSRDHAVELHGMERDRVLLVGTPRFDSYYVARDRKPPSHFAFPYALFVGCAIPFDELTALRALDAEIAAHPDIYRGLKVVYRPHPWRQKRLVKDVVEPGMLAHVVVDPQVEENYRKVSATGKVSESFQPSLDYYPSLLANAELVTGPLTTMIVEGAICKKPNVVLVYDDGKHFTTPSRAFRAYEHFRGIEKIEGFTMVPTLAELGPRFRAAFQARASVDGERIDRDVRYYLHAEERPYPQRLAAVIDRVVGRERSRQDAA